MDAAEKVRERRFRRTAARRGLVLRRCDLRDPQALGYGLYRITDAEGRTLIGEGYTLTIEQVEQWLADAQPQPVSFNTITGHALDRLRGMASNTFDACVTSPPYWLIRNNEHSRQIGMEYWPTEYISNLVEVFAEVRRVLKPAGTLWINIADSYSTRRIIKSDGKRSLGHGGGERWRDAAARGLTMMPSRLSPWGIKEKDIILLPYELAAGLRAEGWHLRSLITWVKTNAAPDPAPDRPRRVSEPVLLLTKQRRGYYYVPQPGCETDVWTLPPSRGHALHSSMMPLELARRCIEVGSPPGGRVVDPFGGLGTTRRAAKATGRSATCIEINPLYARASREEV